MLYGYEGDPGAALQRALELWPAQSLRCGDSEPPGRGPGLMLSMAWPGACAGRLCAQVSGDRPKLPWPLTWGAWQAWEPPGPVVRRFLFGVGLRGRPANHKFRVNLDLARNSEVGQGASRGAAGGHTSPAWHRSLPPCLGLGAPFGLWGLSCLSCEEGGCVPGWGAGERPAEGWSPRLGRQNPPLL